MKPYGSKISDYDYHWTGTEEIVVYGNSTNPKRSRRFNKKLVLKQLDEMYEDEILDEIDRLDYENYNWEYYPEDYAEDYDNYYNNK